MADVETYADIHGEPNATETCPSCSRPTPRFAYVRSNDPAHEFICGLCYIDNQRNAEEPHDPFEDGWDSEFGNDMKAERNKLLDQYGWTVRADSPLTEDCQASFLAFLKELQALTVIYERPALVIFPQPPALEFMPVEEQVP